MRRPSFLQSMVCTQMFGVRFRFVISFKLCCFKLNLCN